MRAITRHLQPLLFNSRYSFSGFGIFLLIQLDHTTPISTKTTSSPKATPPINKSTPPLKIRTNKFNPPSEICDMSTPLGNPDHFPVILVPTLLKTSRNWQISLRWVKISIIVRWMWMSWWGEYLGYCMFYVDYQKGVRAYCKNWIDTYGAGEICISNISHGYWYFLRTQRCVRMQAGCDQF